MAAGAAAVVRGQRRRGAHLRNRVVPDAGALRRLLIGVDRRAARARSWAACASAASCCRAIFRPRTIRCKVYALLEIAIGVIGLLLLVVLPLVGHVYTAWGGYGVTGYLLARARRQHLPAAADARDGRHASRGRALGADDAGWRVVARIFLRGQHRRRGDGDAARGVLPAARLRHEHGHLCRRGDQLRRRWTRPARRCENSGDSGRDGLGS